MNRQTYTTYMKQSQTIEKLDKIDFGGTFYIVNARYIHNNVVVLDLVPDPAVIPVVFNVRIMMPMYVGVDIIKPE